MLQWSLIDESATATRSRDHSERYLSYDAVARRRNVDNVAGILGVMVELEVANMQIERLREALANLISFKRGHTGQCGNTTPLDCYCGLDKAYAEAAALASKPKGAEPEDCK